jgi:hypothetical protein
LALDLPRFYNTTPAERSMAFPCDRCADASAEAFYRAVDIDAPRATAFRWLCQLRVAPYSYDVIDNFPHRSPRRLTPGGWLESRARGVFLGWGDLVMMRKQLLTLKSLAEETPVSTRAGFAAA